MKKIGLILSLTLGLAISGWAAVSAPTNLAVGYYNTDKTTLLYWDDDTTIAQWNIYFGGLLTYTAPRASTGVTPTSRRSYLMTGIASTTLPVVITMRALKSGSPLSSESVAITMTAVTPVNNFVYVVPAPNAVFPTSGSSGGASSSVSVTAIAPGVSITVNNTDPIPVAITGTATAATTFALNTTSPTAISVVGVTLTSQSGFFLDNSLGSVTMCVQTGTSNTPPANSPGNYLYVNPGQQVLWLVGKEFLATDTKFYYGNNQTATGTAKTTR